MHCFLKFFPGNFPGMWGVLILFFIYFLFLILGHTSSGAIHVPPVLIKNVPVVHC